MWSSKEQQKKKDICVIKAKQNKLLIFGWPSCSKTPKGCLREVLIYFLPLEFVVKHATVFDVKAVPKGSHEKEKSLVSSLSASIRN
ncbi:hypothetical protein F2Q69_00041896 [Brassica cretica]|uniref:Uncharacterized protein n=1 Tax=Brassica cretica TaxID=69181 RepID=A0A8S9NRJ4_BRACR|nr:hypothetical protein F2Q69_00041896 [Brassica cretica]